MTTDDAICSIMDEVKKLRPMLNSMFELSKDAPIGAYSDIIGEMCDLCSNLKAQCEEDIEEMEPDEQPYQPLTMRDVL